MRQQEAPAPAARPPAAAETEQAAPQPHGCLNFLWWLLLCGWISGPSPPPPPPPSSAVREDQPREAAAGSGPTAAPVANPQEDARQPTPAAPAAEQPPPLLPVDDSRLKSQTSSSIYQPAPVRQSLLRKIVMEARWMKLQGKGELEIEESGSSIDSRSHPDCSREFAPILNEADAALAAADAKRQAEGQGSSSRYEFLDSDDPENTEESSAHPRPSFSSSV